MQGKNIVHIPIFVINLDKDTDRLSFMDNQLKELGLPYARVNAFYGNDERVLSAYDESLALKENSRPLTKGEKGCAYSHCSIYERMVCEQIESALILEDDVRLPPNFINILEKELSRKHKKWEWLSFDYPPIGMTYLRRWFVASGEMVKERKSFLFYAIAKFPYVLTMAIFDYVRNLIALRLSSFAGPKLFLRPLYHTGAYVITLSGAKKVLTLTDPLRFSADRVANQARVRSGLKLYGYVPRLVQQDKTFETNVK